MLEEGSAADIIVVVSIVLLLTVDFD